MLCGSEEVLSSFSLSSVVDGFDATDGRRGCSTDNTTGGIMGGSGGFAGVIIEGELGSTWLLVSLVFT
jgi:hypothetical protein